jgi:hypothetical protein
MAAVTADGKVKVDAVFEAENITIGNVKVQDGSTSNLANVNSIGQLAVQNPPNLDAATSTLAKESGGNLAGIKSDTDTIAGQLDAKTSTLAKETGGNLAAIKSDADTIVTNTGKLDVNLSTRLKPGDFPLPINIADPSTGTQKLAVNASGQAAIQNPPNLDAATSTLAKESGGNLAAAKADLDTIATNTNNIDVTLSTRLKPGDFPLPINLADPGTPTQKAAVNASGQVAIQNPPNLDAATSTLAKESGGNLATVATNTSGLAKESGGNLAAAKSDLDTLVTQFDAKTSTLAKESGGNLAGIKSDLDKFTFDSSGNLETSSRIQNVANAGAGFVASTGPNSVGSGDIRFGLFIAGTGKVTRITRFVLSTDSTRRWRILINPTITTNGTLQTPQNRRPASSTTAVSQLYLFPTLSADGSLLYDFWVNGGETKVLDVTLVLDPNQVLNFISSGGAGQNASLGLEWDEQSA